MKSILSKGLLLLAFGLLAVATLIPAFGQRYETYKNDNGIAFDTVVNGANKTLTSGQITSYYDHIGVQCNLTRLSGTAAGSIILQGSIDGTYFVNIDTLSVANAASQSLLFLLEDYPYAYLRASYTGSGTMSVILRTRALYKKK